MKIVISGGLGYVGGRLSKYLAEQGYTVVALSRKAGKLNDIIFPANLSVTTPEQMLKAGALEGTDVFIHLAAMNENDCIKYPEEAIEVNITQTLKWLDAAYKAGVNRFIYFSTAHVYGKPLTGYYDESSNTFPVHPYAITHKCAEDYVLSYQAEKGMSNLVIRLTNSFGGPAFPTADRWTLLVNDLCRSAINYRSMKLTSDGSQLRDFICLNDVCRAVIHILMKNHDTTSLFYNFSSGKAISVWEMACTIKDIAETWLGQSVILVRQEPQPNYVVDYLEISNRKLLETGFRFEDNFSHEIETTLRYFKEVEGEV